MNGPMTLVQDLEEVQKRNASLKELLKCACLSMASQDPKDPKSQQ